jgi:hypothetical protein
MSGESKLEPDPEQPESEPLPDRGDRAGEVRGRRTLDRPPAERYGGTPPARGSVGTRGSGQPAPHVTSVRAQQVLPALGITVIGALAILVLNVVLAITTGLLAVAAVTGYLLGQVLRWRLLAIVFAVGAILVATTATWLASLAQGGVLGPADYLAQTMGLLLPALVVAAAIAAWLGAR